MSILESARSPEDKEALHVISLTADSHFLFGMKWTPLLGGRLAKVGRKRARLLQATHYLVGSEPGAVLGYVKVKESMVSQKASLYSAAMQYARAFPSGTVACVLPHPEYGYWLVAAHEGAVAERKNNQDLEAESLAQIKKAGVEVIENVDTEPFRAMAYQPVRKLYTDKFGPELLNKIDAAQ